MNTPVTALDQRYSDSKAVAVSWDETRKWQGAWQFAVRDSRFYNVGAGDWPSEVFSVAPVKVFAHAKGNPFGATTHRF
jgi:hypothetical protein